jgi:feruloyl-CoA synthase
MTALAPTDVPFRDFAIETLRRPDGSFLIKWPDAACDIHEGAASPEAPMTLKVANVTEWLRVWAAERPDTLFMAERNALGGWDELSYAEAWKRVRRIAWQLVRDYDGPWEPMPRLAIVSPNSMRQALLTLAAIHVGVAVSPISPAYALVDGDPVRLRAVLDALSPRLVYTERPERTARALAAVPLRSAKVITSELLDAWCRMDRVDDELIDLFHREARGNRVAKIMFTSGSTGIPRGMPMTHDMLAAAQVTTAALWTHAPEEQQVYLEWLPWHHVMGGNIQLHRVLRQGATAYLDTGKPVPGLFDASLKNLREVAPTFYFNVPLGYAMLVPELERDAILARQFFSRLGVLSFGGSALSPDLIRRLQDLSEAVTGRRIVVTSGYGATETCGPGLMTPHNATRAGSLGLPSPGMAAKLVPYEDRYELRLAGQAISGKYLGETEPGSQAVDEEGFYRTGDAVRWVDEADAIQGLAFAGRISEDFKLASGTWVNTAALRQRLLEALSPLVADAVLTGQDRQAVGALLFLNDAACRAFCKTPDMARADLVLQPALIEELERRLRQLNARGGASSTRIERLMLQGEAPVAEAFEVTDKGYLNQRMILQRRAALVEALYAAEREPGVIVSS